MLISLKKIWRYLCFALQAKKIWVWPRESEVVIYDAASSKILLEYLKPWNPEIIHVRNEQINMRVLLKSFFRGGRRVDAYIDCFIEKVNPRLVLTTIDNKTTFYTISQRHPGIKTLFLQNGIRGFHLDVFEHLDNLDSNTLNTFFVDYMLVFGSVIGKHYSRYVKGNIHPIGSIKNNFVQKEKSPQPGVMALLSQYLPPHDARFHRVKKRNNDFISQDALYRYPDQVEIQLVVQYAKEKNKRLVIVPRFKGNFEQEKQYHTKLMGCEPEFIFLPGLFPNYNVVDSAEIIVSLDSTLGYESISRGNKTAIFSFRGTLNDISGYDYGWPADYPDEGPFWTNKPDPDIFIRILDYLFEVSDEQWKKDVETTNFSSIMEYDSGNTIFQSILETELGPPPTTGH
jgi:surface carbohydrate biosynthesis protein